MATINFSHFVTSAPNGRGLGERKAGAIKRLSRPVDPLDKPNVAAGSWLITTAVVLDVHEWGLWLTSGHMA